MKSHQEEPTFKPLVITFESQKEIDELSDALYHDKVWIPSNDLPEELTNAIQAFRCLVFKYSSSETSIKEAK
jgi:hypothetical protein